jgi:hypothetical protein
LGDTRFLRLAILQTEKKGRLQNDRLLLGLDSSLFEQLFLDLQIRGPVHMHDGVPGTVSFVLNVLPLESFLLHYHGFLDLWVCTYLSIYLFTLLEVVEVDSNTFGGVMVPEVVDCLLDNLLEQ